MRIKNYETEYMLIDCNGKLTALYGPSIEKFCVLSRGAILKIDQKLYRVVEVAQTFRNECHTTTIFLESAYGLHPYVEQYIKSV